jgi:hypothetical protein
MEIQEKSLKEVGVGLDLEAGERAPGGMKGYCLPGAGGLNQGGQTEETQGSQGHYCSQR